MVPFFADLDGGTAAGAASTFKKPKQHQKIKQREVSSEKIGKQKNVERKIKFI